ncbi:hypothetical protein [Paenibacillus terrae]|uniref:Uncharacterized protein n=1 Tax=Paenibacillus terrae TaxID=159743 RepID=A0A0D7WWH6_9BACL|nr:hypothetical protein [Paenibacillus terrae]KJD43314.1 hypothetical protein QD47_23450 [Paenibacillus terrae]
MLVYNGESVKITVVSDGNPDTVIQPGEYAKLAGELVGFATDMFHVLEDGEWYAKREHCYSGADVEIYNNRK